MQSAIAVRVQASSLPKAGVVASLRFVGEQLIVEGPLSLRAATQQVAVRVGGFDDDQLFLSWQDSSGAWSLTPVDKAAQSALLTAAPPGLATPLRKGRLKVGAQQFKWNAVLGSLAALVLGVVLLIWQLDRVERWLAEQVPVKTEQKLGEAAVKQLKQQGGLDQDSAAAKAVAEIGGRLTQGSRYRYQWFVKDDDSINAFAMPGGVVVVHRALIEAADTPEQLAGVLAHEVQHVEQRHILQNMIHSAGLAVVLGVTLGDVSALASVLLHSAGAMRHGRELEAQADAEGLKALVAAGIPPQGMAEFFRKLMDEETKKNGGEPEAGLLDFMSSHPATAERLAAIEAGIQAQPCDCKPLAMDWAAVKSSLKDDPKESPAASKPLG